MSAKTASKPVRRRALRRILGSPSLHFLLLGGLAWLAYPERSEPRLLLIDSDRVEQSAREWQAQYGRPLSAAQRNLLVEQLVREALLADFARTQGLEQSIPVSQRLVQLAHFLDLVDSRAGRSEAEQAARDLGLHASDPVIRQFLANAGELVLASRAEQGEIREQEILDFYREHEERFLEPAVIDLRHVYVADANAGERKARRILERIHSGALSADQAIESGDVFVGGHRFENLVQPRLAAVLGGDFADALRALPDGQWSGPVRSAYGWHLVFKRTVRPSRVTPLDAVRDRIQADLRRKQQHREVERQLVTLRNRYQVVVGNES